MSRLTSPAALLLYLAYQEKSRWKGIWPDSFFPQPGPVSKRGAGAPSVQFHSTCSSGSFRCRSHCRQFAASPATGPLLQLLHLYAKGATGRVRRPELPGLLHAANFMSPLLPGNSEGLRSLRLGQLLVLAGPQCRGRRGGPRHHRRSRHP